MRRVVRSVLVAAAIGIVWAPVPARADGFVVPWFGTAFSQGPDFRSAGDRRPAVGAALGSMGGGVLGFDIDFGYTGLFFGPESAVGSNSLATITANLIAGPSIETRGGKGVRPYVNFGVGLIRSKVAASSENNFGWNAAGGVMGFFSSRVGVRGDLRYFHTVNNTSAENTILLRPGKFHFWRAYVGLILR